MAALAFASFWAEAFLYSRPQSLIIANRGVDGRRLWGIFGQVGAEDFTCLAGTSCAWGAELRLDIIC
eukprot:1142787-Pelagomonas_calceolata.AAC.2